MTKVHESHPNYRNPLDVKSVSQCTKCPLLGREHVPSFGDPNASIFILGQSPGQMEVERGEPFVGQAGALLDLMLETAGLEREECYIANAIKCHPPNNRPGFPEELRNCRESWLYDEIRHVKPQIVLILGMDAAKALDYPESLRNHGKVRKTKNAIYLFSYHPAYFLRRRDESSFLQIGQKLKELIQECES